LALVAIAYWGTVRIGLLFVARPEGVAEMRREPPDESVDRVIQRADEALYKAKQSGRNCTVIFGPDRIGAI
jgi:GGDEF domain-containing protein